MSDPAASPSFSLLTVGDPAPWFRQRSPSNPSYAFDTTAGRYILLCFFGSAGDAAGPAAIDAVLARGARFDGQRLAFFGVSIDPSDEREQRVSERTPGIRYF